ncbi:MAG: CvpA family protein [Alphaproteobacteria bacterium]|nr:CvpA family protein [Alphaproteobacteria bacterium]
MSVGLIDMIVIGTLVFSVLFSLYRGLVSELLGISSWILAGIGAMCSYTPMQPIMGKMIENPKIAGLCGSLLVSLVILVIMTVINARIGQKLRQSALSGLDRILGLLFGLLRGILLIALFYIGLSMIFSDKQIEDLNKDNISIPYIQKTVQFLKKFLPENIQTDLGLDKDKTTPTKKIGVDLKRQHKLPEKSNKKAIDRFVNEIKQDVTKKVKQKAVQEVEQKIQKETQDNVVPYNQEERQSLDNMVEELMKKGE